MKAQNYRTTNQTNSGLTGAAKRRRANSTSGVSSRSRKTPRKSGKATGGQGNGFRVIMMLAAIGAVIAVGFILAQHSLINVLQLKRAEESLKSELDTLSSQQRFYTFKKEQALSTQESDRAAKESGLVQPGLTGATVAPPPPKPETEVRTQAKTENQAKVLSSGLVTNRSANKSPDKRAAATKQPAKAANVAKIIKVTNKLTPTDKGKKDNKPIAKNQKPQKEVKRQR
jgi:cell division protein FtsB